MEEFIENLSGSVYEKIIKKVSEFEIPILFDYEMSLDLFFFNYVWSNQDKFVPKGDKIYFQKAFGSQVDLLNILWIYRCKKYYTVSDSQIYSFLIPVYYHLERSNIKSFVEADNDEEFFDLIDNCYYGRNYGFDRTQSMESQFGGILNSIYMKDFKDAPYSLAAINAYLHLKDLEITKVVTAMECIRYGYSPEVIAKYLNQKKGVL